MPYFKPLNLLYIHVPKTGGMSIEEYFYNKCKMIRGEKNIYGWYLDREKRIRVPDNRTLQHFTYQEICKEQKYFDFSDILGEINNTTILVSVRNPFERIMSDLFWGNKIQL